MSTHTNMFAKDDDEHVQDFVVFPPLPLLLETSADFERVQNVTVDVVPFSPPPGSNAILVDEVVDHPSDTGTSSDSMPASYSLPGFPGFSASASESMPSFSFASSSGSASNLPASSSSTSASGSVDTLGSASSASSQSHSLKTVGNNVRIENRERHLHHFEQSVLSIEQVEEFNDFFTRGIFEIAEPLYQSWIILKRAAAPPPPPPPTEAEAFGRVMRDAVPRNIPRSAAKRKAGPPGADFVVHHGPDRGYICDPAENNY